MDCNGVGMGSYCKNMKTEPITDTQVQKYVESILGKEIHAKRILSIANGALGVIEATELSIHGIGHGLAAAKGLNDKHAIKQIDRYLSNDGIDIGEFFRLWIPYQIGGRKEIYLAFDWTDYDRDDQSTVSLYLATSHGRAMPLLWMTVVKSELAGQRNDHEDDLLEVLREALPPGVRVTILADRGFGDHKLYELLEDELKFDYIIRFRQNIEVTSAEGESKPARDWAPESGKPLLLRRAKVTQQQHEIPAVVCVKAAGMKDAWCLATSRSKLQADTIVKRYSKRFTTEEGYRDIKDSRFGMGLKATRIGDPKRRDRLLIIAAIATVLLTLLGAAGESLGLDRMLKANTVKKRTHSLFRQGCHYYNKLPKMNAEQQRALKMRFGELVLRHKLSNLVFGVV